jgi:hypothetical protein
MILCRQSINYAICLSTLKVYPTLANFIVYPPINPFILQSPLSAYYSHYYRGFIWHVKHPLNTISIQCIGHKKQLNGADRIMSHNWFITTVLTVCKTCSHLCINKKVVLQNRLWITLLLESNVTGYVLDHYACIEYSVVMLGHIS